MCLSAGTLKVLHSFSAIRSVWETGILDNWPSTEIRSIVFCPSHNNFLITNDNLLRLCSFKTIFNIFLITSSLLAQSHCKSYSKWIYKTIKILTVRNRNKSVNSNNNKNLIRQFRLLVLIFITYSHWLLGHIPWTHMEEKKIYIFLTSWHKRLCATIDFVHQN